MLAKELAPHGLDVLVLEAGARFARPRSSRAAWTTTRTVEYQNGTRPADLGLVDDNGTIPRVDIRTAAGRRARSANRQFLAAKAVELLRAADAKHVHRLDWPPLLLHNHWSMRMGLDSADSVCDEWGAARFVDALYIADDSMLANSLGGSNPTPTTQAIVTRQAERIMTEHFGGDPWVATSPGGVDRCARGRRDGGARPLSWVARAWGGAPCAAPRRADYLGAAVACNAMALPLPAVSELTIPPRAPQLARLLMAKVPVSAPPTAGANACALSVIVDGLAVWQPAPDTSSKPNSLTDGSLIRTFVVNCVGPPPGVSEPVVSPTETNCSFATTGRNPSAVSFAVA